MDWAKIKGSLGTLAPMIAGTLGTPVAGVAVKVLCDVFGLDDGNLQTPDTIAAAIKAATPEQLLQLKQAEIAHAEFMAKLGFDNLQALEKIAADDRASARGREIATHDNTPRYIAAIVVCGYAMVQWYIMAHIIAPEMREIVMRSMGTLDAALALVLGYYFGSSSSSRAKDATIGKLTGGTNDANA